MKHSLFFSVILLLALVSCAKDDPLSTTIIGTYNLISYQYTDCDDQNKNIPITEPDANNCVVLEGKEFCDFFFRFEENNDAIESISYDDMAFIDNYTYTVDDQNNSVTICDTNSECFILTENDGVLTGIEEDEGCTLIVKYKKS